MTEILKDSTIRNFSIIAHIDHGKSTLCDRILELTHTIEPRDMREQVLDNMELEREKGITIKARAVSLSYKGFTLNLIDTPGHVDFTHEVSRSLAACEGAVLLIDASEGIQAQTVSNFNLARSEHLKIIPVINKMDLPTADPERVKKQLENMFSIHEGDVLFASARAGSGIAEILDAVISRIPAPEADTEKPLRALIFDSVYDNYRGVLAFVRVIDGEITPGMKITFIQSLKTFSVTEVGLFKPFLSPVEKLPAGMVGYLAGNIRKLDEVRIGDTVTESVRPSSPLPGYKAAKAMVFSSLYPVDGTAFEDLKRAIEKLRLNDSSFSYMKEGSPSLGFGLRCGFLGMLHLDIIKQRLEREYKLNLITTAPSVLYRVKKRDGEIEEIDSPAAFPKQNEIAETQEFYLSAYIILPARYLGPVIELCKERRGIYKSRSYLDSSTIALTFEIPAAEIMTDFFDRLKSLSSGYASVDYEKLGWRSSELSRLDILLNGERVPSLSSIVHQSKIYSRARALTSKLKEVIPSQLFPVDIQAAIGGKVIARETKKALRKDVTAKLYGGDVTRKRKLIEKQKRGKKKMKKLGRVMLSQEVLSVTAK